MFAIRADLATGETEELGSSPYGAFVAAWSPDHSRALLADGYTVGDIVLYEVAPDGARTVLHGTPIDEREEGVDYPLNGLGPTHWTLSGRGLLLSTTVFEDTGSAGYIDIAGDGRDRGGGDLGARARRPRRARGDRAPRGRPLPADLQHRRLLVGVRGVLRRERPHARGRARARRRGAARGRRPARALLRRGERRLRALVLHRDRPDAALGARAGSAARAEDARARARHRARGALGRRGRVVRVARRSARVRASVPARRPSSATRGRDRSSSTCTAARRGRSARTSPGSRCR